MDATPINHPKAFEVLAAYNNSKADKKIFVENGVFRIVPANSLNAGHQVTPGELGDVINVARGLLGTNRLAPERFREIVQGARKYADVSGEAYLPITNLASSILQPPKIKLPVVEELGDDTELEETAEDEVVASWSTVSVLSSIFHTPVNAVSGIASYLYSFFANDNEIKQKKYQLSLQEMMIGFDQRRDVKEKIQDIITQLKKVNPKLITPLQSQLLKALLALAPDDPKKYAIKMNGRDTYDYRQQHKDFIIEYRKALESPEFSLEYAKMKKGEGRPTDTVNILLELARSRYNDTHMYSYVESIVENVINSGNQELAKKGKLQSPNKVEISLSSSSQIDPQAEVAAAVKFSEGFDRANNAIKHRGEDIGSPAMAVKTNKIRAHANVNYDPVLMTNIPFVHFDLPVMDFDGQKRNIRFIRMGSPTIDINPNVAVISPEFRAYLMDQELNNKTHVYFSLQMPWKHERNRTLALVELQKEFPNFKLVILAQDSPFYRQEKQFAIENQPYNAFKQVFMDQMLKENLDSSGYYFPDAWKKDPAFTENIAKAIDDAKQALFPDKDILTVQEKKDLIEISYSYMKLFVLRYSKANTANITCKDAIDRAAKNAVILTKVELSMAGEDNNKNYDSMIDTFTHGPAFLVRKNVMEHKRADRLKSAGNRLDDKKVRDRIATQAADYGITRGAVPSVKTDDSQRVSLEHMLEVVPPPPVEAKVEKEPQELVPPPAQSGSWFWWWK